MFGEPKDEESECNARLFIADNYGDNSATMRCQLPPGHEGLHREEFARDGGPVVVTWTADERERCDHGCGQWDHDHRDENIQCPKDADAHEWSDCAHCHPGEDPKTCAACGGSYYYEEGHRRHCPKEPFTCAICGESGVGPHDWPMGCPKEREMFLAQGAANEFLAVSETIVSAAIRGPNGIVYSVQRPARHHDVLRFMPEDEASRSRLEHQGFITSTGRFVGRTEAAEIARSAGQLIREPTPADTLTSEDVW